MNATSSSSSGKKWLVGCALGCGALLLLGIMAGIGGAVWVGSKMAGYERAERAASELEERFESDAFVPQPDGRIAPERMEAFLAVRESVVDEAAALVGAFAGIPMSSSQARELDEKRGFEKFRSVVSVVRAALGVGGKLGDFFAARNHALLEQGMSRQEYAYVFTVAYLGWLDHDVPRSHGAESTQADFELGGFMFDEVTDELHDLLLDQLERQLAALPENPDDPQLVAWREELGAEVQALREDPDRLAWEDGVPARVAASLEPYRKRLQATWRPEALAFELMQADRGFRMQ